MFMQRPTPWSDPLWKTQADAWISAELRRLGITPMPPTLEVKKGSISCVLRAPTDAADAYFKVASKLPLFVNEATVTQGLSALFPGQIPSPLAIHPDHGWLLLPDFGPPLGHDAPLPDRCAAMQAFARLQVSSAPHAGELLRLGCIDRRLPVLKSQVDSWLETLPFYAPLSESELGSLRGLGPRLKSLCDEAARIPLPDTLVHGDMHMGNVARTAQGFLIFDWTDACLSHPFIDLLNVQHEGDDLARNSLLGAYLEPWQAKLNLPELKKLWDLMGPLSALHQGVSYQHIVVGGFEGAAQQFEREILFWPKKILELLSH